MKRPARQYHETTSYDRSGMGGHFLDWDNQPRQFKTYGGMEEVKMPEPAGLPQKDLFALYRRDHTGGTPPASPLCREDLSRILVMAYAITGQASHSNGSFYYRSAASAGALYPVEVYLACEDVSDLDGGLYHFQIASHSLARLRRGRLSPAIGDVITGARKPTRAITFFLTAILFRTAWKYRDRAYRYHLLDTGHVLENLLLSLRALGFDPEVILDFDDRLVNRILGLDDGLEVVLAMVQAGPLLQGGRSHTGAHVEELPLDVRSASRMARREKGYAEIHRVHRAGYGQSAAPGPPGRMLHLLGPAPETWEPIPPAGAPAGAMPYPEAVFRRRSKRNFTKSPLSLSLFNLLLRLLGADDETSWTDAGWVCVGILTGHVESLLPGFYLLNREGRATGLVSGGNLIGPMSRVCLDQAWLSRAAVHFLFLANMEALFSVAGARAYRHAMITAGRLGQRLYLAASALGLGCCGIGAFYDNEASELLGLNGESRLLYLIGLGPVKSVGKKGTGIPE